MNKVSVFCSVRLYTIFKWTMDIVPTNSQYNHRVRTVYLCNSCLSFLLMLQFFLYSLHFSVLRNTSYWNDCVVENRLKFFVCTGSENSPPEIDTIKLISQVNEFKIFWLVSSGYILRAILFAYLSVEWNCLNFVSIKFLNRHQATFSLKCEKENYKNLLQLICIKAVFCMETNVRNPYC